MKSLRISLVLFAFNQRELVGEAVESCFAQDSEPLDILLSDDASTDGTGELLEKLAFGYRGPHTVRVRSNPTTLGIGEHYNQAIHSAAGELIVTAAGDDVSLPHRVRTLARAWDETGNKVDLIASSLIDLSRDGKSMGTLKVDDLSKWQSPEQWLRKRPKVIGASHAFTRRLHQHFGDFRKDLVYEDQIMAFRASCRGGGITIDEPLVSYRRGGMSHPERPLSPSALRDWTQRRHERQRSQYLQVQADLARIGRSDLWRRKPPRRLRQSELTLALLQPASLGHRLALLFAHHRAGLLFGIRMLVLARWPMIEVMVKRVQRLLRSSKSSPG